MSGALGVPTQVSMLQANQEESNLQRCPRITKKARRSGEVRMIHSKYAKGKLERAKGGEIVGCNAPKQRYKYSDTDKRRELRTHRKKAQEHQAFFSERVLTL